MASSSTMAAATSVDLFDQQITVLLADGSLMNLTMGDIRDYTTYGVRISINYGSQIGASFILLVIIMLLTKHEKKKSPIFILNALALLLNIIRLVLQCVYYTSAWYNPYAVFAQDYTRIAFSDVATSIATSVMTFFVTICIEASLIFQVRVVSVTASKTQRFWTMVISCTVAMITIAFRFALTVVNSEAIQDAEDFQSWAWLASATQIMITISICFFSLIFLYKLGYALMQRRKLGLKQFGPMQIIFIMGCQTMIVPVIFTGLQYCTEIPEFGSQVLTTVAIFLPLSAIWAATAVDNTRQAFRGPDAYRRMLHSFPSAESKKGGSSSLDLDTTGKSDLSPPSSPSHTLKAGDAEKGARHFSVLSDGPGF